MSIDQSPQIALGHVAQPCDTRRLRVGGGGSDVRVETAARGGYEVDGDLPFAKPGSGRLGALGDLVDQLLARRSQVGSAGVLAS